MPEAQGWYRDPFAMHDARWISAGWSTALVRDGEEESFDAPPAGPLPGRLRNLADLPDDVHALWPAERASWLDALSDVADVLDNLS